MNKKLISLVGLTAIAFLATACGKKEEAPKADVKAEAPKAVQAAKEAAKAAVAPEAPKANPNAKLLVSKDPQETMASLQAVLVGLPEEDVKAINEYMIRLGIDSSRNFPGKEKMYTMAKMSKEEAEAFQNEAIEYQIKSLAVVNGKTAAQLIAEGKKYAEGKKPIEEEMEAFQKEIQEEMTKVMASVKAEQDAKAAAEEAKAKVEEIKAPAAPTAPEAPAIPAIK